MSVAPLRYSFATVAACPMCGADGRIFETLGIRKNGHQGVRPRRLRGVAVTINRCGRCRLVFPNPLPRPQSIGQHYDVDPAAFWGPGYSREIGSTFQYELRQYRELEPRHAGPQKALDIGVGLGKCMQALTLAGFDTIGLEPSATFAAQARAAFGFADRIVEKPMEDVDFPDSTFDLISFGAVLEHLPEPGAALRKATRWLRPGGLIHVEVPSSAWLVARLGNLYYRLIGTDYVGNLSPMHPPYHFYEFSAEAFRRHGETSGYALAKVTYHPCTTGFPFLIDRILRLAMAATDTGMQMIVWLRRA